VLTAALLASCTTSPKLNAGTDRIATATRQIVGTSLIGAKGATQNDQDKIDDSVAGLCGAGSYKANECATHERLTASSN
jgi:hypothetical protein